MAAISRADATWEGDLMSGGGHVKPESGAFAELPITWASRAERMHGTTSPEELIAAAHASCFSMAFSNGLAKAGHTPERLDTTVEIEFVPGPRAGGSAADCFAARLAAPAEEPCDARAPSQAE